MTTIKNSFHNTSVTVRKTEAELDKLIDLANFGFYRNEATKKAQAYLRRIRKQLCGMSDCTCGDGLGRR